MGATSSRILGVRSLPRPVLVTTLVASVAGQLLGALQGWPLWGLVLAGMIPWVPLLTMEIAWSYRHYRWLALFYVLVLTQGGHVLEHVVQMIQIHLIGLSPAHSHGVFGALDIEWVHFIWNSLVLIAVIVLLFRFRRNPWLWAALVFAGWHEAEHLYIMTVFLNTNAPGSPGLLASGGAIGGGLPLIRPDLHFFYNVIETTPLVIGFLYQLRRSHDEWLAKALPSMSKDLMVETTDRLATKRFPAGAAIVRQGDPADAFYIVVTGTCLALHETTGEVLATMGPGDFFGEIGLLSEGHRTASVRAVTASELLVLDKDGFRTIVTRSRSTEGDLRRVAGERLLISDTNRGST